MGAFKNAKIMILNRRASLQSSLRMMNCSKDIYWPRSHSNNQRQTSEIALTKKNMCGEVLVGVFRGAVKLNREPGLGNWVIFDRTLKGNNRSCSQARCDFCQKFPLFFQKQTSLRVAEFFMFIQKEPMSVEP